MDSKNMESLIILSIFTLRLIFSRNLNYVDIGHLLMNVIYDEKTRYAVICGGFIHRTLVWYLCFDISYLQFIPIIIPHIWATFSLIKLLFNKSNYVYFDLLSVNLYELGYAFFISILRHDIQPSTFNEYY